MDRRNENIRSQLHKLFQVTAAAGDPDSAEYVIFLDNLMEYLTSDARLWSDLVRFAASQVPGMRDIILSGCFDFHKLRALLMELNLNLRYSTRLSRRKWVEHVLPAFKDVHAVLNGLPSVVPRGANDSQWFRQCRSDFNIIFSRRCSEKQWRKISPRHEGKHLRPKNKQNRRPEIARRCGPPEFAINAVYISIVKALSLQLVNNGCRGAMRWFTMRQTGMRLYLDFQMGEAGGFLLKMGRDGMVSQMGRSIIMAIMTNCNITSFCNSTINSDIIVCSNRNEDAYNLHLLSQRFDNEIFLLRLFGMVDPKSGQLLFVIVFNTEDTNSLMYSIGRPEANTNMKWIFSIFDNKYHVHNWTTILTPFSFSAPWQAFCWLRAHTSKWNEKCLNEGMCPFVSQSKSKDVPQYKDLRTKYDKLSKYLNNVLRQQFGYACGTYNRGEDALSYGLCGLHAELGITCIPLKHAIVRTIEYVLELQLNEQLLQRNHGGNLPGLPDWTLQFMLNHITKCCKIPFKWNKASHTLSEILKRMSVSVPK